MQEVVKKEIVKLLDTGIIYPIVDSPWVSPIHCVPKKCGITVVTNENDELAPTITVSDTLLQPLFDECFCPPPCVDHPVPEVVAPVPIISTGSPSSTSVDQDAPSPKFVDLENPNHVYKLKKALYGLKQAPRVWYDLLLSFLLSQKFSKGTIDPTLFIRREGKDILLDSYIALTAFADADHAGCQDTEDEQVENKVVELYFVRTEYQLAGIFTKALGRERLNFLINKLGMRSMSPEMLKSLADEEDE
ncbi:retrovirus-related pol polyprotein from transposon TNT 1-94 [Tanacetum coccineum]